MQNKVALVTGGSRGIGKAIAIKFGEHGYSVAITYKSSVKDAAIVLQKLQKLGVDNVAIRADFNEKGSINNLFKEFDKNFSDLSVLVNNAGWTKYIDYKKINNITPDLFDKLVNIHLKSTFFCSQLAVKRMKSGPNNSIINISSIAAYNAVGSNIIYSSLKAAIVTLTKSLSLALGPKIRVNGIAPGVTNTDMTKSAPGTYIKQIIQNTPLKRLTEPEDVAAAAFALAEDLTFVNGKVLIVDGGVVR